MVTAYSTRDPGTPRGPVRDQDETLHRIVVVGGGAAGLELATRLGDTLGQHKKARVTLIERSRIHLWKPLLHQVAAGSIDVGEHELDYLAQAHWHHFIYRFGEMTGLDRTRKEVHIAATFDEEGREITPPRSFRYDTLVIAIGCITNDFDTPGAKEHAVPLETLAQAVRFNRRLVNACIRAHAQEGPVRPGQLHVAIIGAGATGAELAAELHRTARAVVAFGLDRIDPEKDIRITLIEAADRILPAPPRRRAARSSGWRRQTSRTGIIGTQRCASHRPRPSLWHHPRCWLIGMEHPQKGPLTRQNCRRDSPAAVATSEGQASGR